VILDEPNANLDPEGEAALTAAIQSIKKRNGIAIVIAHRPSALQACDLVGIMQRGRLVAFGPKEETLAPRKTVAPVQDEPATPTAPAAKTRAPKSARAIATRAIKNAGRAQ
jgi:ATP-binding cassette, subfamily C, bacterial